MYAFTFYFTEDYWEFEHEVTGEEPSSSDKNNSTGSEKASSKNSSAHSRERRHVGAPDHGGYQRLMATGTVVASLAEENNTGPADSIDVVFTTYWQYPAKVRIILPEDKACIEKYRNLSKAGKTRQSLLNLTFRKTHDSGLQLVIFSVDL